MKWLPHRGRVRVWRRPRKGAWIEIYYDLFGEGDESSPPQGGVD